MHTLEDFLNQTLGVEEAYWFGILFSKARVVQRTDADIKIRLNLPERNIELVDDFTRLAGPPTAPSVNIDGRKSFGFVKRIQGPLAKRLVELGLTANRPMRTVSEELANSPDFWRGVMDTSGTMGMFLVGNKKYPVLTMSGGLPSVELFNEFLSKKLGFAGSVSKPVRTGRRATSFNGRKAVNIAKLLFYEGCLTTKVHAAVTKEMFDWKPIVSHVGRKSNTYLFEKAVLDESVFDEPLTPEARYWLGLLLADGCVHEKKGQYKIYHNLVLGLKASDAFHIEKFRCFLKSSANIHISSFTTNFGPSSMATITVGGQTLCNRLVQLGITPRKTKTATVHSSLEMSSDFWRGMIDGDGSISMSKNGGKLYPAFCLGSTASVIGSFAKFLRETFGFAPKIGFCRGLSVIAMNCTKAQTVLRQLYYPGCVALDRKLATVQECLARKMQQRRESTNSILVKTSSPPPDSPADSNNELSQRREESRPPSAP